MTRVADKQREAFFKASVLRLAQVLDTGLSEGQIQAVVALFEKKLGVNPEALALALERIR